MRPDAGSWFRSATFSSTAWDVTGLLRSKGEHTISVVIPARNEAPTIGGIVAEIDTHLVGPGLVDELIVIDSDSSDDTAALARACGAQVYAASDIRPDLGRFAGKGEALWKSQFVTTGDLLVFIDADLVEWGPHFVSGLLGPLLDAPERMLIKGFYDRILDTDANRRSLEGGRVTELVARPLINLFWPHLAAVIQPLAGEWAIRRAVFETLAVPVGYGVEMASLLDVVERFGIDAVAQVDLGQRAHSHQAVHDLAVMGAEILATALRRAAAVPVPDSAALWQYARDRTPAWAERIVPTAQRPAAVTIAGYLRAVFDT